MEIENIQDLLRAATVTRWHTVQTQRDQSIAEHQWNVTMICMDVVTRLPASDDTGKPEHIEKVLDLLLKALSHDAHEILDGDVPAPVKDKTRVYEYRGRWQAILDLADKLESYWFIHENAQGRHAEITATLNARDRYVQLCGVVAEHDEELVVVVEAIECDLFSGGFAEC